jgi:hypothetical protein
MRTVPSLITRRVKRMGQGAVFTPSDFLDLGGRAAMDQALSRLVRAGTIRRLARGVYDYPRMSQLLGPISPVPDVVAQALARKTKSTVQVAGAQAANALGLSTQVPAHAVYLTDGPSRRVAIGRRVIALRHTSPKHLVAAGSAAGTVVQALRYLGKDAGSTLVDVVTHQLSPSDRRQLIRGKTMAPDWMRPVIDRIAGMSSSPSA